ncbi:MAG: isochorismatase family protein [Gammaproteobacteria bacterium]|jgi:nicotinamidase-related amidase
MTLCEAGDSQLVIVDVQEKLAAAMAPKVLERMVKRCARLLDAAAILGVPVIHTEQYPRGLGDTLSAVAGHLPETATTLDKTCFSCAAAEAFCAAVVSSRRGQIVLTGMETHVCILQTALDLAGQGLWVFVAEDAVCARSKRNHRNALARLRQCGVVVTNTESVIFEWLRDARHEHFREISPLLK